MRVANVRDETERPRILVDRLWPRGVSKEVAALDGWAKELAPSTELRQAFHAGMNWDAFVAAYQAELAGADCSKLHADAVLLTSVSRRPNHADVLMEFAQRD